RTEHARRAAPPGLEGFRRRRLSRERRERRRRDRALRGPGVRVRGPSRGRRARKPPRRRGRGGAPERAGQIAQGELRASLLVRGALHVRHGARRRQEPLSRARIQRGPVPLHGHREPGTRPAPRPDALYSRFVLWLGSPDGRDVGAPLQPSVLSRRSVWPHDNALIARGLARYGFVDQALTLWEALFDASVHFPLQRMPELFCGFPRQPGEGPILYPVACAPQAWSAASVLLFLQVCIGIEIDAPGRRVLFTRPRLPASLNDVRIHNLEVARAIIQTCQSRAGRPVRIPNPS